MESLSDRRAEPRWRLVVVLLLLGLFVTACVVLMYKVGDLAKFQDVISENEARAALRDVTDPEQLDQVIKLHPSNRFLGMLGLTKNDAAEIDAAAQKLLGDAEPRPLPKLSDLGASSRNDLEALGRDLKTAENKLASSEGRYGALLKAARDKLEKEIRSQNVGDDQVSAFMAMIDEQHAAWIALTSKRLAARADYDGAYEKCVALLVRDFGVYQVTNGQFIFPFQSSANGFNRAAAAMTAAAARISELDEERTKLMQSRLSRWKAFVTQ